MKKILVSLPEVLLEALDRLAASRYMTRSGLIRELVVESTRSIPARQPSVSPTVEDCILDNAVDERPVDFDGIL